MTTMDMLKELEAVRGRRRKLASHRSELEHIARTSSAQTRNCAHRLLAEATLAVLEREGQVTREAIEAEIDLGANDRDRFAIALCHDWLDGELLDDGEMSLVLPEKDMKV